MGLTGVFDVCHQMKVSPPCLRDVCNSLIVKVSVNSSTSCLLSFGLLQVMSGVGLLKKTVEGKNVLNIFVLTDVGIQKYVYLNELQCLTDRI